MKKVSVLVSFLSAAVILLTLNRKINLTQGLLDPYGFLRWQDFHAMLTIPLIMTLSYTLLFLQLTRRQPKIPEKFGLYLTVFASGIFLYGVSSGNHEVTNYLHHLFCMQRDTHVCQIISYNDDNFSHLIFYISSILMTVSLLFFEKTQPEKKKLSFLEMLIVLINALVIGLGLFMNLAFEKLGIDLYAFGMLSTISLSLLWQIRKSYRLFPIITYCAIGYGIGTISSCLYKLFLG